MNKFLFYDHLKHLTIHPTLLTSIFVFEHVCQTGRKNLANHKCSENYLLFSENTNCFLKRKEKKLLKTWQPANKLKYELRRWYFPKICPLFKKTSL